MSVLRGLAAGAAGAAAYNVYHDVDLSTGRDLATGLFEAFQRKGASNMAELARMHRQVDDLQAALLKSLHDRAPATVIVQGSGRPSGNAVAGAVVVVGGTVLYLRFVRGWKLADMMYVTKGALTNMQEAVNQSLANVRTQVEAAATDLLARLHTVTDKQDALADKQEEMDDKLDDMDGKLDEVKGGVAVLQHQVAYSNHAITMLCGALSEVAKRVGLANGRYVRALDGLVHGAPQPQQPRIEAAPAHPMLPHVVEDLVLLDAATGPGSPDRGPAGPRPNPAVFAFGGDGGGNRAAAAVAAGAVPRQVGATSFSGSGAGVPAQHHWGSTVSDIVRPSPYTVTQPR